MVPSVLLALSRGSCLHTAGARCKQTQEESAGAWDTLVSPHAPATIKMGSGAMWRDPRQEKSFCDQQGSAFSSPGIGDQAGTCSCCACLRQACCALAVPGEKRPPLGHTCVRSLSECGELAGPRRRPLLHEHTHLLLLFAQGSHLAEGFFATSCCLEPAWYCSSMEGGSVFRFCSSLPAVPPGTKKGRSSSQQPHGRGT